MYTAPKNPFKRSIPKEQSEDHRNFPSDKVVMQLNTDDIIPNPSQPRFVFEDEPLLRLADSIRRL